MIHVTDEPMEGVAFDVQGHAQWTDTIWTNTHGEMISSDLHGDEEATRWMLRPPSGGRDRTKMVRGFASEKRRTFHQRYPDIAWPRGINPLSEGRWL